MTGLLNSVKAQLGSLDPEFNTYDNGTRPNQPGFSEVNSTLVQPDGKIIMGGFFNVGGCGPTQGKQLVRLNSDGVIDGSFNPGSVNSNVFVITMQTDGKMIVAGNFTSIGGLVLNRIARLNPDGTLDSGFNPGLGFNHHVRSVNIQPDGKLIVGGLFTTFNGNTANRIVRLNPDGSQDATFNPGNGFNNYVYSTALMPDGRIVVGGQFTAYNGSLVNRIARLNPDGSLDATFSTSAG
ncbi:MAG: delta-60 repeat domain-containing protein, partial [Bacteroidota bacterium]